MITCNELKCCPFCGGSAQLKERHGVNGGHGITLSEYEIKCELCGATSKKYDNYDNNLKECIAKAILSWNKRI